MNKHEAPRGYIAIRPAAVDRDGVAHCDGCAFFNTSGGCFMLPDMVSCMRFERSDYTTVIFKRVN